MSELRAGFVAIIGEPNAGKSTLLNLLLESKVAIVTPKPQTTRQRITGIVNTPNAQLIFVDSPGVLTSETGVNAFLKEEYQDVIRNADVVIVLLGADQKFTKFEELLKIGEASHKPWQAFVSKYDLNKHEPIALMNLLQQYKQEFVTISSTKHGPEARKTILDMVTPLLPKSESRLYPEEVYTTQSVREMCAEIIREKCFDYLHQEIPYGLAIKIDKYLEEKMHRITASIVVEKNSHKGMVIGKGGSMLKRIGSEARAEIEKLVQAKVFLELHVSVKENWTFNKQLMRELGYVIKE
jgi:GTP-binding protein Era